MSFLLSPNQEAVACVQCIQKESHCCEGKLRVSSGNVEWFIWSNRKTSGSAKNYADLLAKYFRWWRNSYGEEALGHSAVFKWHKPFCTGERHFGRQWAYRLAMNSQNWTWDLRSLMSVHANHSQMVDEFTAIEISHGTCQKILSDNLNRSYVTKHSVPCVLMQDLPQNSLW
jgi:hypothetical protein